MHVNTYWGAVRDSLIANNVFVNSNSPNNGEIVVEGPNNVVKNNVVEGGNYGSVTLTTSSDCCSSLTPIPTLLSGNRGVAGTGVTSPTGGFAVSGDNVNAYETGFAPTILDDSIIPVNRQSWTPTLLLGGASTGITYTTDAGQYWVDGKTVHICGQLSLSNKGTATGTATITGLPYSSDTEIQSLNVTYARNFSSLSYPAPFLYINSNGSTVKLFADYTTTTALTDANFSNSTILDFCGSYQIP